ncbi:hypothetical protein AMJ49_02580 [Parcubacteria bacterium DG_74_2]|nr:MAG: hypothetical protein AMJ49_02580 [Parcubacteria bacterium DG_74_2]
MGNWNVKIKGQEYRCDTREDRDKLLAAVSNAARNGEPTAIVRSHGAGFRTRREDDGTIRVTTSSEERGTETMRFRKTSVDEALEYYADC